MDRTVFVNATPPAVPEGALGEEGNPFPTITAAIEAVPGGDARVVVMPGVYVEQITINVGLIHLHGVPDADGRRPRIVRSADAPSNAAIDVHGASVVIEGLSISGGAVGIRVECTGAGCAVLDSVVAGAQGADAEDGVEAEQAIGIELFGGRHVRVRGVEVRNVRSGAGASHVSYAIRGIGLYEPRFEDNLIEIVTGGAPSGDARGVQLDGAIRPVLTGNVVRDLRALAEAPFVFGFRLVGGVGGRLRDNEVADAVFPARLTMLDLDDHPGAQSSHDRLLRAYEGAIGVHVRSGSLGTRVEYLTVSPGIPEDPNRWGTGVYLGPGGSVWLSHAVIGEGQAVVNPGINPRREPLAASNPRAAAFLEHVVWVRGHEIPLPFAVFGDGVRPLDPGSPALLDKQTGLPLAGSPAIDAGDPARGCGAEPSNAEGVCRLDVGHGAGSEAGQADDATEPAERNSWWPRDCEPDLGAGAVSAVVRGECVRLRCADGRRDDPQVEGPNCAIEDVVTRTAAGGTPRELVDIVGAIGGLGEEGTIVEIPSGYYSGVVHIDTAHVTVRAVGGPAVLYGEVDGPAIRITGDGSRVEGFIVRSDAPVVAELEGCSRCALTDTTIEGIGDAAPVAPEVVRLVDTDEAEVARVAVLRINASEGPSWEGISVRQSRGATLRDNVVWGLVRDDFTVGWAVGVDIEASPDTRVVGTQVARIQGGIRPEIGGAAAVYGLRVRDSAGVRTSWSDVQDFLVMSEGRQGDPSWHGLRFEDAPRFESRHDLVVLDNYSYHIDLAGQTTHGTIEHATLWSQRDVGTSVGVRVGAGVADVEVRGSLIHGHGFALHNDEDNRRDVLRARDTVLVRALAEPVNADVPDAPAAELGTGLPLAPEAMLRPLQIEAGADALDCGGEAGTDPGHWGATPYDQDGGGCGPEE